MSHLDEWEHRRTRRKNWPKRAERPAKRAVKTQLGLFAPSPKKPEPDNGTPFDDFDQLPL
jgi:hypothetical protein